MSDDEFGSSSEDNNRPQEPEPDMKEARESFQNWFKPDKMAIRKTNDIRGQTIVEKQESDAEIKIGDIELEMAPSTVQSKSAKMEAIVAQQ